MGFTPEKCPQCNKVVEWKHENHVVLSKKQNYEITHVQSLTSYLAFGDLDSKFSVGEDLFEDTFRCPSCGYLHTSKSNLDYAKERIKMDYNKSIAEENLKDSKKIEQIIKETEKKKSTKNELTVDEQAEELTKDLYAKYKVWQIKACAIRRNYDEACITGYQDIMKNAQRASEKRAEVIKEWHQTEAEYLRKIKELGEVSVEKKREFLDNFPNNNDLTVTDHIYWMGNYTEEIKPRSVIEKEWFSDEIEKRERERVQEERKRRKEELERNEEENKPKTMMALSGIAAALGFISVFATTSADSIGGMIFSWILALGGLIGFVVAAIMQCKHPK